MIDSTPLETLVPAYNQDATRLSKMRLDSIALPLQAAPQLLLLLIDLGYGPSRLEPGHAGVARELDYQRMIRDIEEC